MPRDQLSNDDVKDAIKAGKPVKLADGRGLYLVVRGPGRGYWIKQFRKGAAFSSTSLGSATALTPHQARREREGFDVSRRQNSGAPARQPRTAVRHASVAVSTSMTFAEARDAFLKRRLTDWSGREQRNVKRLLEKLAAPLDKKRLDAVTDEDVAAVLKPMWRGPGNNQGTRLRSLLERVFRSQRVEPNPANWPNLEARELLSANATKVVSHSALKAARIPGLVARLKDDVVDRCLRFIIVTGARATEAADATWQEFDLDAKLWTVPASRMKAGVEHKVPLSDAAIVCLVPERKTAKAHSFVFPATRGASGGVHRTALLNALKRLEPNATTHGMRSTLATWAQDHGFASDVIEVQLAHQEPNRSKRPYQRSEFLPERRKLLDQWAAFALTTEDNKALP
jgi:integrase